MSARVLLAELLRLGATVTVERGVLWIEPHHILTTQLRVEIHRLKPTLMQLVTQTQHAQQPECLSPAMRSLPGIYYGDDGLWHWRRWIVPTIDTLPALERK